jgi:hypothetical protein
MTAETRSGGAQGEMRPCGYCAALFVPARPQQAFCSTKCRSGHHVDRGATGAVRSVRRIKTGASVVVHLTGPAAESALQLHLGDEVRIVESVECS